MALLPCLSIAIVAPSYRYVYLFVHAVAVYLKLAQDTLLPLGLQFYRYDPPLSIMQRIKHRK